MRLGEPIEPLDSGLPSQRSAPSDGSDLKMSSLHKPMLLDACESQQRENCLPKHCSLEVTTKNLELSSGGCKNFVLKAQRSKMLSLCCELLLPSDRSRLFASAGKASTHDKDLPD